MADINPVMPQQVPEPMVNVRDPDTMEIGSLPQSQLNDAVGEGYEPVSQQDAQNYVNEKQYGTGSQQALTALESAAAAGTFGLSRAVEKAYGVSGKSQQLRQETNPVASTVGTIGGLAASTFIPGGEGSLLEAAGKGVSEAAGLAEGTTALSKIGSLATRNAVESSLMSGGDEVGKMIMGDPDQTAGSAMADIGLSGLLGAGLGGALGSVNPLWKATVGKDVSNILTSVAKKAGGIEGVVPDAVHGLIDSAGIDVAPEIKTALSGDPLFQDMANGLMNSSTQSGRDFQGALLQFKQNAAQEMAAALGRGPEELADIRNKSIADLGEKLKSDLIDSLKARYTPINQAYEKVSEKFGNLKLAQADKDALAETINQFANNEQLDLSPSSPEYGKAKLALEMIQSPRFESMDSLKKAAEKLSPAYTDTPQTKYVAGQLKGLFRDAEENILSNKMKVTGGDWLDLHMQTNKSYGELKQLMSDLNTNLQLKTGKKYGASTFMSVLEDAKPEKIAKSLANANDSYLIDTLQKNFPTVADKVKDFHVDNLLKKSMSTVGGAEYLSPERLMEKINLMSPELKSFAIGDAGMGRINSIGELIGKLPQKWNPNTARTMDQLGLMKLPGQAVAMVGAMMSHNPLIYPVVSALNGFMGRDLPDAVRYGLLKFLGTSKPVESGGFKAAVDYIYHASRGENLLGNAAKGLFQAGRDVIPEKMANINQNDREKLDKTLQKYQVNQDPLVGLGGQVDHYMPDHAASLKQTGVNAVNYLNQMRPSTAKMSPLDSTPTVDKASQSKFDRALDIANKPLIVLDAVKNGTVTSHDLQTMKTLYPALYQRAQNKIMEQMSTQVQKGQEIPYKTRLGLSLFMGEPLDSTMHPIAINAIQSLNQITSPQAMQPQKMSEGAANKMSKLNKSYMTPQQARESSRTSQV